jgi:hypothetical protein
VKGRLAIACLVVFASIIITALFTKGDVKATVSVLGAAFSLETGQKK